MDLLINKIKYPFIYPNIRKNKKILFYKKYLLYI